MLFRRILKESQGVQQLSIVQSYKYMVHRSKSFRNVSPCSSSENDWRCSQSWIDMICHLRILKRLIITSLIINRLAVTIDLISNSHFSSARMIRNTNQSSSSLHRSKNRSPQTKYNTPTRERSGIKNNYKSHQRERYILCTRDLDLPQTAWPRV